MKTITLPILNQINIKEEQRIYSSVYRFAYNRFQENLKEIEVREKVNNLFKSKLNSWLIQCAIKEAQSQIKSHKALKINKVLFGGKRNLSNYLKGLISKDEFKELRLKRLVSQGEACKKANRLFNFKLNENKLILKLNKNNHQEIILPKLRKNLSKELILLQNLIEENKIAVTVSLNSSSISLTYDETILNLYNKFNNLKENRVLGIDLNPNFIGISVLEFDKNDNFKIIHKELIEFSNLTKKSGKSSSNSKSKYIVNKRNFENIQICYKILKLIEHFKCKKLSIEDLKFKSNFTSKNLNRLCKNSWNKNLIFQKLQMLSNIYGFELVSVNPAYSSVIGNILYKTENAPDPILSSIEIARRGYKKYSKNWFYPNFNLKDEQWKQTLSDCLDWKSVFEKIKNLKLKYRVQLDFVEAVFSKFYIKSKLKIYKFA